MNNRKVIVPMFVEPTSSNKPKIIPSGEMKRISYLDLSLYGDTHTRSRTNDYRIECNQRTENCKHQFHLEDEPQLNMILDLIVNLAYSLKRKYKHNKVRVERIERKINSLQVKKFEEIISKLDDKSKSNSFERLIPILDRLDGKIKLFSENQDYLKRTVEVYTGKIEGFKSNLNINRIPGIEEIKTLLNKTLDKPKQIETDTKVLLENLQSEVKNFKIAVEEVKNLSSKTYEMLESFKKYF